MIQHEGTNATLSSSFLIIPTTDADNVDDDRIEVARMFSSEEHHSHRDSEWFDRDTSDTSRHFELNNTRDSATSRQEITVVNTHDSILDLDSQCDDAEDDTSFCDDDENMLLGIQEKVPCASTEIRLPTDKKPESRAVSPTPSHRNVRDKRSNGKITDHKGQNDFDERKKQKPPGMIGSLTLYSVTDSFVDSICTSTVCVASEKYENSNSYSKSSTQKNKSAIASMDDKMREFQESCHSAIFDGCDADRYSNWEHDGKSPVSNKAIVSMDIWQLLGCSSPPGESELAEIWSMKTTSEMLRKGYSKNITENKQPVRASIKKRLKRIHRLRIDDRRVSGASRHGVTITNHSMEPGSHALNTIRKDVHMNKACAARPAQNRSSFEQKNDEGNPSQDSEILTQPSYRAIEKSYSMLDDSLATYIGQGVVEAIPVEVDEGYDSDPEVNCYSMSSPMIMDSPTESQTEQMDISFPSPIPTSPSSPQHETSRSSAVSSSVSSYDHPDVMRLDPIPTDDVEMRESVQQTLNSTWTLTWHPNEANRKKYSISHNKPICINMWMERGTVITNSGVVIEPAFMWRDAYQPLLLSKHKLNHSTQKPWSMRLLNACRITPYVSSSKHRQIDRSKYPMARQNASFILKSCGGEEFLLEAGSAEDAVVIAERWKLVVARFACLAVTEDVGGIAKEFFHPTCSDPKMLTVSDPQNENVTG